MSKAKTRTSSPATVPEARRSIWMLVCATTTARRAAGRPISQPARQAGMPQVPHEEDHARAEHDEEADRRDGHQVQRHDAAQNSATAFIHALSSP